jgi:hypothetical protein
MDARILAKIDAGLDMSKFHEEPELKLTYITEREILTQKRIDDFEYCRAWTKLGKQQKINRLMEYMQHISGVYGLSMAAQNQLKKLLLESINSDLFQDGESVEYDACSGNVLRIMNLQKDSENGEFYIAMPRSQASPAAARQTIPKVKPLALGALKSAAGIRKP